MVCLKKLKSPSLSEQNFSKHLLLCALLSESPHTMFGEVIIRAIIHFVSNDFDNS